MTTEALPDALREADFQGDLQAEAALARFTTWRIGGKAEWLATPVDRDDLLRLLTWANRSATAWRILGNGSNLLIDDAGVRGLVIRTRKVLDAFEIDGTRVTAGAGISFPALARRTAAAGLAGLEFAAGIPGTFGGALVMNAGWHKYEVGNFVESVSCFEDGALQIVGGDACEFGYRTSRFRDRDSVLLEASLNLERGPAAEISARLEQFADSRKLNQPTEWPSCGSVFLKPPDDFAGRLIEAAGLKGARVGDIEVSTKHANFFVNHSNGRSADVLKLVRNVEEEVREQFGVELVREFEYWS